jgi:hypothetical protein
LPIRIKADEQNLANHLLPSAHTGNSSYRKIAPKIGPFFQSGQRILGHSRTARSQKPPELSQIPQNHMPVLQTFSIH